jgi:hypothetical protein
METLWRISPWFARVLLGLVTVLFAAIGAKFLFDPVGATKEAGLVLSTAEAATRVRVGFGAFPLSFAVVTLACVVSARRVLSGLWIAGTVVAIVTAGRILGIVVDGPAAESVKLLHNEVVLIALVAIAITLETLRQRRHVASEPARRGQAIQGA